MFFGYNQIGAKMPRKDRFDESAFYEKWQGKRTRIKDLITWSELLTLEDTIEPLAIGYDYFGPIRGTRTTYMLRWDKDRQRRLRDRARRDDFEQQRLREIEPITALELNCQHCGHQAELHLTRKQLQRLAGKRFVCTKCGTKSRPFLPAR